MREEIYVCSVRPFEGRNGKLLEIVGFLPTEDGKVTGGDPRQVIVPNDGFNIAKLPKVVKCFAEYEDKPGRNGSTYREYSVVQQL